MPVRETPKRSLRRHPSRRWPGERGACVHSGQPIFLGGGRGRTSRNPFAVLLSTGGRQRFGQVAQQRAAIAAPGAAVHAGQRARPVLRPDARAWPSSAARARSSPSAGGTLRSGPRMSASVSACSPWPGWVNRSPQKKVPVERVHQQAAVPAVRHVRRVEPLQRVAAQRELLAVGQRARRPVGQVVDRHHRGDLAAQRHGLRRRRQQPVQRAALVGLDVREAHVAQALDRHHGGDGLAHQREQLARTGVEQQRLVVDAAGTG